MANLTQIPSNRVPFIDDRTGLMTREWFIFFQQLNVLMGSGSNTVSLTDLLVGPPSPSGLEISDAIKNELAIGWQTPAPEIDTTSLMLSVQPPAVDVEQVSWARNLMLMGS
jgi:hypothetical protein